MPARTVPEWQGKDADSAIPQRVRLRVFDRDGGRCQACGTYIIGGRWQCDHIVSLINGGENRERNLQVLCTPCHTAKTASDVAEKAKTARVRKKHLGLHKPKNEALSRRRVETDENGNQYEWTGFRWRPVRATAERHR